MTNNKKFFLVESFGIVHETKYSENLGNFRFLV
jgi:hypothetical protein